MAPTIQSLGIDRLTREQRLVLVEEIWATIASEPYQPLLTENHGVKRSRVVVLAVFHSSRDPAIWQGRK